MFKALILQAQRNLSGARMEFMIRDRLSWTRFLNFDLGGPTPDENTIRLFRDKLIETGTLKRVMKAFDWQLRKKSYIPMSGQIVDASLVPAPKQRNTEGEKAAIKAGKSAEEIWPDEPNKGGPEGYERAPDAQDQRQATVSARRRAPADDRGAGLRLQKPYRNRSAVRFHPRGSRNLGRRGGWPRAPARRHPRQHQRRRLGGQRLPLAE
jgi:hypothetical protein